MSAGNLFLVMIWQKAARPKTKLVCVDTCSLLTRNGIKSPILSWQPRCCLNNAGNSVSALQTHGISQQLRPAIAQRWDHLPQELGNCIFVVPNPDFGHQPHSAKAIWYKTLVICKTLKAEAALIKSIHCAINRFCFTKKKKKFIFHWDFLFSCLSPALKPPGRTFVSSLWELCYLGLPLLAERTSTDIPSQDEDKGTPHKRLVISLRASLTPEVNSQMRLQQVYADE